jgi:prepilin-type N-terminal cleavage/methylation domain-containing protein
MELVVKTVKASSLMRKNKFFYKSLMRKRGFYKRGFTLLEILVTVALIVFGVTSVVGVMSQGVSSDMTVEGQIKGLNLAQEKMEELKNRLFVDVISDNTENPLSIPSGFSEYSRAVVVEDTDPTKLKKVTVNVTWVYQGNAQMLTLVTLLAS